MEDFLMFRYLFLGFNLLPGSRFYQLLIYMLCTLAKFTTGCYNINVKQKGSIIEGIIVVALGVLIVFILIGYFSSK